MYVTFDDDTDVIFETEDGLDEAAADGDVSPEAPAGLALGVDRTLSAPAESAPDRTLGAQEFFDFDTDDDIYRNRDLDR